MRIQVTTSINVRSNTVPPTPTQSDNASSQPEENRRKIETPRSKSPIPFLPPLPDMATARFKASQRPPPGSRLSAWLHGTSVLNNGRGRSTNHNPKASRTSTYCYHQTPRRRSRDRTTGLRPVASTRGVIDPVHSPTTGAWPVPPRGQEMRHPNRPLSPLDAYQTRMLKEMGYPAPNTRDRRRKTSEGHRKSNRTCFPRIKDPKIRRKAIGCLFFGNILAIILTIYLALATSNSVSGSTFHAVFIFFILILTIIFTHYLIRLCMLAIKPQKPYKCRRARDRTQWPSDEEAALTQHAEPVLIVLATDERANFGAERTVEDTPEDEEGSEKDLPPPPPVYGNWRGSVRAGPDLIHWQLHTNQPDVQREARELIFAGSGHRPPSYTSREMIEGAVGSSTVARPLPLFAERRRAAGVAYD